MRIAQVITLYLPEFVGGATLVCARSTRALAARGHALAVFCGRPDPTAAPGSTTEWTVDDVPVTGVAAAAGHDALKRESWAHPAVTPAFERFLERHRPDVVHFHSLQALGATLLDAAAARGIPIVVTLHDWWWFCVRLFLVDPAGFVCPPRVDSARCHCAPAVDLVGRRRVLAAALAQADRILTPSRFLAASAIASGVPRDRVEVCPNGVDPVAPVDRPRPGPVRFGYVGGPDNRLKGLPTLLAALATLDVGGWELTLHGVGRGDARVPATVRDRVRTAPRYPPAAAGRVLGGLDCLLVPSLMRESFSLVTREALAAGVPVIASDSGGPAEVVAPGVNGLLVATGDGSDLAAAMRRVVLDPALRRRLRAGARATAIPTVAAQAAQLEGVYAAVVAARAGGAAAAGGAPRPAPARRSDSATVRESAPALPARVLFVTGIDGAPLRYRVTNLRDQLAHHGVASTVVWDADPDLPAAIAAHDLVVLSRVAMRDWIAACLGWARHLGRRLVFSCDDLVFDPAATPAAALALLPPEHRAGWEGLTARYAATLAACDAFLAPTEPLAAAAAARGVPAHVVRNGLGDAQLAVVEALRKARPPGGPRGGPRLVYASGSLMHDRDFAVCEAALAAVLAARPTARLRLIGYLRPGAALAPFADRIERLPFLPWQALFAALAECDVVLAPLETGAFAAAKSEVKYLEAAALGLPTVATPTPAFRHAIGADERGLLAASPAAWERALGALLDDPGLRRRLGNAALADTFCRSTPEAQADTLAAALATVHDAPPRAAATALPAPPGDGAPRAADRPGETGRVAFEPEDADAGAAQLSDDTPSPFLLPGRTVGQRFRATGDELYRIDLRVGTDARPHRHRLIVRLGAGAPGAAQELRRVVLDTAEIADQGWVAAEFAPLAASAGRELYLWVEAEGASPADAVTLRTYVRGWGEAVLDGLHLDHRPVAGSLCFRSFHRPGGAVTCPGGSPSP